VKGSCVLWGCLLINESCCLLLEISKTKGERSVGRGRVRVNPVPSTGGGGKSPLSLFLSLSLVLQLVVCQPVLSLRNNNNKGREPSLGLELFPGETKPKSRLQRRFLVAHPHHPSINLFRFENELN